MFGTQAQPQAPQAPSLGFGTNNNNTNSNTTTTGSQFNFSGSNSTGLFGNSQTTGQTTANALSGGSAPFGAANSSSLSNGFSLNKPASTTTSLFGNSNTGSLGGFGAQQQQSQMQQPGQFGNTGPSIDLNSNPYGLNIPKPSASTTTEMPKPLTPARKVTQSHQDLMSQLKRKRSTSINSLLQEPNSDANGHSFTLNALSLIKKLGQGIGFSTSDEVNGIFSPSKATTDSMPSNYRPPQPMRDYKPSLSVPKRSSKLGELSSSILSKPDYRRLTVRHASGSFKNYEEINPDLVANKRRRLYMNGNSTNTETEKVNSSYIKSNNALSSSPRRPTSRFTSLFKDDEPEYPSSNVDKQFVKSNGQKSFNDHDMSTSFNGDISFHDTNGYWCVPTIEELSKLSPSELSHVANFTVGRVDHGEVEFTMPVDLTEFIDNWKALFGQAIIFKGKTIQVYPEEYGVIRAEGNGLNVPALITLQNCFVIDKATGKPIKDPLSPQVQEYIKKRRAMKGMKYVRFDCFTGSYTFQVEHFSIWGIVDDEEDKELIEKFKRQQANENLKEESKSQLVSTAVEHIRENIPGLSTELTKFYPITAANDIAAENLPSEKRISSRLIPGGWGYNPEDLMDDDVEDDEDYDIESQNQNQNQNQNGFLYEAEEYDDDSEIATPTEDEDILDADDLGDLMTNTEIPNLDKKFDGIIDVKAYEPDVDNFDVIAMRVQEEYPVADTWKEQLELSSGFYSVFNKHLAEASKLDLNAQNVNDVLFNDLPAPTEPKAIEAPKFNLQFARETELLINETMSVATFTQRPNGMPKLESPIELMKIVRYYEHTDNFKLWNMLSILFDDKAIMSHFTQTDRDAYLEDPSLKEKFIYLKRRELFANFLSSISSSEVDRLLKENENDPLESIFILVCANQLEKAVEQAMATDNPYLAVIISMVDSNDPGVTSAAKKQLDEWQSTNVLKRIPNGVIKIYQLISGDILSNKYTKLTDGLNWSIVLNLLILYGNYENEPLNKIIDVLLNFSLDKKPEFDDIYYNVLKLYGISHLEKQVLNMYNKSGKDYTNEWLMLQSIPYMFSPEKFDFKDEVILKFSEELNENKLYIQSICVLSFLNDDDIAKREITKILNENIDDLKYLKSDTELDRLTHLLRVPADELFRARGSKFYQEEDFIKSAYSYLQANDIEKAHGIMLETVAPECIISNGANISVLQDLILSFQSTSVESWNVGGGLYLKYIKFLNMKNYIGSNGEMDVENDTADLLEELINDLPSLVASNFKVKVAKSIMLKNVINSIIDMRLLNLLDKDNLTTFGLDQSEMNLFQKRLTS